MEPTEALSAAASAFSDIHAQATSIAAAVATSSDPVTLPGHYVKWKIEPIYFIMENGLDFVQGNVIKYIMRWQDKDGVQDLKKARRYLDMQIRKLEGDEEYASKA